MATTLPPPAPLLNEKPCSTIADYDCESTTQGSPATPATATENEAVPLPRRNATGSPHHDIWTVIPQELPAMHCDRRNGSESSIEARRTARNDTGCDVGLNEMCCRHSVPTERRLISHHVVRDMSVSCTVYKTARLAYCENPVEQYHRSFRWPYRAVRFDCWALVFGFQQAGVRRGTSRDSGWSF